MLRKFFNHILSKFNFSNYIQKLLAKKWVRLLVIVLTTAYFIVPIDFLPEIITGPLGYVDDVVLVTWIIKEFKKFYKRENQEKRNQKDRMIK